MFKEIFFTQGAAAERWLTILLEQGCQRLVFILEKCNIFDTEGMIYAVLPSHYKLTNKNFERGYEKWDNYHISYCFDYNMRFIRIAYYEPLVERLLIESSNREK